MPYFEITQDGNLLARAGTDDVSVITASVIVSVDGGAALCAHGMRANQGKYENFFWVMNHNLRPGDRIEIGYVSDGKATAPISTSVQSVEEANADWQRVHDELQELEANDPIQSADKSKSWTQAPRPRSLKVSTSRIRECNALLGDESLLQAVMNYTERDCVLEVDSVTILEDGRTKGTRWLREVVLAGERVSIAYAT